MAARSIVLDLPPELFALLIKQLSECKLSLLLRCFYDISLVCKTMKDMFQRHIELMTDHLNPAVRGCQELHMIADRAQLLNKSSDVLDAICALVDQDRAARPGLSLDQSYLYYLQARIDLAPPAMGTAVSASNIVAITGGTGQTANHIVGKFKGEWGNFKGRHQLVDQLYQGRDQMPVLLVYRGPTLGTDISACVFLRAMYVSTLPRLFPPEDSSSTALQAPGKRPRLI